MKFIKKNSQPFQVDISGPKGNAMHLVSYLKPFMGEKEAFNFIRNNSYLTSVGTMAHYYQGFDIITDLSEQDLETVKNVVNEISVTEEKKNEQRRILKVLVQEEAFNPQLSL